MAGYDMDPRQDGMMPSSFRGTASSEDLDVTVLHFAQWLSDMRSRSNASLQQMLAEMGIIRNGITQNNSDLTEFKRNTATVQQQMQSQICDLRDKLTDAYTEIANMKKSKNQFEQELSSNYHSIGDQMMFIRKEIETMKQGYSTSFQQQQDQLLSQQHDLNEQRMKIEETSSGHLTSNEQHLQRVSQFEMDGQYFSNELKRIRSDHEVAIANLAENMRKWNDTIRDLKRDMADLTRVHKDYQMKTNTQLWDVQERQQRDADVPKAAAAPAAHARPAVAQASYAGAQSYGPGAPVQFIRR